MKKRTKLLAGLLSVAMSCSLLAGCGNGGSKTDENGASNDGGGAQEETNTDSKQDGATQITFWNMFGGGEGDFVDEIVKNFNESQSEVTVEAIRLGRAEVTNKGKTRTVFLPGKLQKALLRYARTKMIAAGPVFVTRTGRPLDRSNIWHDMKALCREAGVAEGKVFPHNLRHLFARTFYGLEKDIVRLADILGHSNVNTTRIYTMESGETHRRQLEQMRLVI